LGSFHRSRLESRQMVPAGSAIARTAHLTMSSWCKNSHICSHRIPARPRLEGTLGGRPVQPLLRQGHPDPVAPDCVWTVFEYLYGGRPQNLAGQLIPVLSHPSQRAEPRKTPCGTPDFVHKVKFPSLLFP